MKDQNDESDDMKCSMQKYITIESMDNPPCVDIQFSVAVKGHDDIFHIGRNECLELIAIFKCLCVI